MEGQSWVLLFQIVPMSAAAIRPPPPMPRHRLGQPAAATVSSLPLDMELVLKVIPMPADCNANGDIFGGWVMAQCDLAGSVIPARHARGRMATVAVNEFVFKQPVRLGDILSFYSQAGAHRPHLGHGEVEVFAERFSAQGEYVKVTEATFTYVAIDDNGRPRPIPRD